MSASFRRSVMLLVLCGLIGCAESVPVNTATPAGAATTSGDSGATSGSTTPTPVTGPTTTVLSLQGSPATTVVAGTAYSFEPTASQSATTLTFTISNPPAWAVFNSSTGQIAGTPSLADVGTTANITITATNGASAAQIGPFDITVTTPGAAPVPPGSPPPTPAGTATLTWTAPTLNTDGTPLIDLAGYHVYYGTSAAQLDQEAVLDKPAATTYVVNGLGTGTYYFAVTAFSSEGTESAMSDMVSKTF